MRNRRILAVCWVAVPLLTVANQACMKLLAGQLGDASFNSSNLLSALMNPWLLGIVLCELLSFVVWLRILEVVPIGRAMPITAIAYVLVLMLGWFGFHEPIKHLQILGSLLILGGVWLLSSPSSSPKPENHS